MANLVCTTPGEQAFQQVVSQKLIGLHLPTPQTTASALRELMTELCTIQEEMQRFGRLSSHQKSGAIKRASFMHGSLRRIYSTATSPVQCSTLMEEKRPHSTTIDGSGRHHKHHHGRRSSEQSDDQTPERASSNGRNKRRPPLETLASVTSDSTASTDVQYNSSAEPLDETSSHKRTASQKLRQSVMVHDIFKRIQPQEGSRLLMRTQNLGQSDPILTASAESLVRSSQRAKSKKHRGGNDNAKTRSGRNRDYRANRDQDALDNSSIDLMIDSDTELEIPVGPSAAAAIASSLYGSEAPYIHVRERARQELPTLVGTLSHTCSKAKDGKESSPSELASINSDSIHERASLGSQSTIHQSSATLILPDGDQKPDTSKSHHKASKNNYV